jgi:hypothetical protein
VHGDAQRFDARTQQPAAALVHLHGHEPRREFDHVGSEAKVLQRLGGFETQQPPPMTNPRVEFLPASVMASRSSMVRIDEYAGTILSGNGRHEGARAGGEDQHVVFVFRAALRNDALCQRDRWSDRVAEYNSMPFLSMKSPVGEGQFLDDWCRRSTWTG